MQKSIYADEYRLILSWLRAKREEKGLTMRDLAEVLDVPHSWVGKVELGERRLDLIEYLRYCAALGIDPHEGIDKVQHDSGV